MSRQSWTHIGVEAGVNILKGAECGTAVRPWRLRRVLSGVDGCELQAHWLTREETGLIAERGGNRVIRVPSLPVRQNHHARRSSRKTRTILRRFSTVFSTARLGKSAPGASHTRMRAALSFTGAVLALLASRPHLASRSR